MGRTRCTARKFLKTPKSGEETLVADGLCRLSNGNENVLDQTEMIVEHAEVEVDEEEVKDVSETRGQTEVAGTRDKIVKCCEAKIERSKGLAESLKNMHRAIQNLKEVDAEPDQEKVKDHGKAMQQLKDCLWKCKDLLKSKELLDQVTIHKQKGESESKPDEAEQAKIVDAARATIQPEPMKIDAGQTNIEKAEEEAEEEEIMIDEGQTEIEAKAAKDSEQTEQTRITTDGVAPTEPEDQEGHVEIANESDHDSDQGSAEIMKDEEEEVEEEEEQEQVGPRVIVSAEVAKKVEEAENARRERETESRRLVSGSESGSSLVGWKVAVQHYCRDGAPWLRFGIFSHFRRPNQLRIGYEGLGHAWLELSTVRKLIDCQRIILLEDCKTEFYKRKRRKYFPKETHLMYNWPVGKACIGKTVKVWSEWHCTFYSGTVKKWEENAYVVGSSPTLSKTVRISGSITVKYFIDNAEEVLPDDSSRILWEDVSVKKSNEMIEAQDGMPNLHQGDAIGMKFLHSNLDCVREGTVIDEKFSFQQLSSNQLSSNQELAVTRHFKLLFTDCSEKWVVCKVEDSNLLPSGEAGVFLYDHDRSMPLVIPVECNDIRATFYLERQLVICEGELMTPVMFEKYVGRESQKKWRISIRVHKSNVSIEEVLRHVGAPTSVSSSKWWKILKKLDAKTKKRNRLMNGGTIFKDMTFKRGRIHNS